jgi:hypothetical protein
MAVIHIYGGLGNQMFQYAFGKSIAIAKNEDLYIDSSFFENCALRNFQLDKFIISCKHAIFKDFSIYKMNNRYKLFALRNINKYIKITPKIFFEKNPFLFDISAFESNSFLYVGFWQSYKYFEKIREVLLREFTLKESLDLPNLEILNQIQLSNSVSLHIRRGDYVSSNPKKSLVCPIQYQEKAIKTISEMVINPTFFIFSDDIAWVKSNLNIKSYNRVYVDINFNNPERDLELIKNCQNNIIANSTFSWWGAWLNINKEKKVITPKIWMGGMPISRNLVPFDWIII